MLYHGTHYIYATHREVYYNPACVACSCRVLPDDTNAINYINNSIALIIFSWRQAKDRSDSLWYSDIVYVLIPQWHLVLRVCTSTEIDDN